MTSKQAEYIIDALKSKKIAFDDGLADDEIVQIEAKFGFMFPPDLKLFLKEALPVSEEFVNWRLALASNSIAEEIVYRFVWPLEGILFDIENNVFWFDGWGSKPLQYEEQATIAERFYRQYPTLIPIFSHRYIPSEPHLENNPVFSVYQTDIIYYGYDLAGYLANEFHFLLSNDFEIVTNARHIEFWSELVG